MKHINLEKILAGIFITSTATFLVSKYGFDNNVLANTYVMPLALASGYFYLGFRNGRRYENNKERIN